MQFVIADRKRPKPGNNDVLVKVHAASVNPKDWKLNRRFAHCLTPVGTRIMPPLFGDDLAGEVIRVGRNVTDYAVGDRVFGMDMKPRTASLAEYAIINQKRIAHLPDSISYEQAAAVPLAGQTALQGLRKGGAAKGQSVLIIGASGGVGTYAVQISHALGCHVTAVCCGRNTTLVKELGADVVIDYTAGDYRSNSGQFDLVFDVTSYETPSSCKSLLKPDGRFISTMGNARAAVATLLSLRSNASLVTVESRTDDLNTLSALMTQGKMKSVVDSRFSLAESEQAYARSRTGRAQGKIVIHMNNRDPAPN